MEKNFLFAFTLLFSIFVYAAPANRESVEKLFTVMQVQASIDRQFSEIAEKAGPAIVNKIIADVEMKSGMALPLEQRTQVEVFAEKCAAEIILFMRAQLAPKIKEDYIKGFSEVLSQDEIDSLISYYSTPIGRSAKVKMDQVDTRVSSEVQKYVDSDAFSEKIIKEVLPKIIPELLPVLKLMTKQ